VLLSEVSLPEVLRPLVPVELPPELLVMVELPSEPLALVELPSLPLVVTEPLSLGAAESLRWPWPRR
jgi:hypothetical protein